ncbi:GTPase family protein [Acidithiobacillus ferriphilus]|uniref:GTPase family protein n=1 Tax=Acidithiobacillus ferriphilus TaxID=1689834 RepID=UPI002DB81A03|nr:GTPase [Acidithiobacillus ferriphilus]MEB8534631.1 50S ribosome-binding GTPase [Acidithiobacillus ferriphilus]
MDYKTIPMLNMVREYMVHARDYRPRVGIFGDTGVGKSSLCNALFGKETVGVSDVKACTRNAQEVEVETEKGGITLVDVPGVGEDTEKHNEYVELYKKLVPDLDIVLWVFKADNRAYKSALEVYNEVLKPNVDKCPVVFVVNQADKIEPINEWYENNHKLGTKQELNLADRIIEISSKFDVPTSKIVAVSANAKYKLQELVDIIVSALPNEKKYGFTRETKEENVSENSREIAEESIWEYVKEKVGDAYSFIMKNKDEIIKMATTVLPFAKKGVDFLKRIWVR